MTAHSTWLMTTVNAVREVMLDRLHTGALDPEARRDVEMAVEELDVMWEELQGQAQLLARENQRYAEFFDHAPDAYVVTDSGGTIREANRAAIELLGASHDVLLRRPLSAYVAEEQRARFVSRLIRHTEKDSWDSVLQPAAGAPRKARFSVRAIPLAGSGVAGLCWLIRPLD